MRAPSRYLEPDGPPRIGPLYAVVYFDAGGRKVSTLYRFRPAARRFARRVEDRGGSAVVYVADIARWST